MPAALSNGSVSSSIRPFDKAMLSMAARARKILNFTAEGGVAKAAREA